MLIYVVDKKDYKKYSQPELEKMKQEVKEVTNEQVIIEVKFSKNGKDFSAVDLALYQLLIRQYEDEKYIEQKDLNKIEEALKQIKGRDRETLNGVLFGKYQDIKKTDDIVEIINNHKNYMFLYMANENELGSFIVENLEEYKMPRTTFNNLESFIDFKEVARTYLHDNDIKVIQIEDLILDLSNNINDELPKKLQNRDLEARTIYDNIEKNREKYLKQEKEIEEFE